MKEHNLLVISEVKNKAKRGPIRPKPHAEYPNHFWGIDMHDYMGLAVFNYHP
jgi:hypothetical protein